MPATQPATTLSPCTPVGCDKSDRMISRLRSLDSAVSRVVLSISPAVEDHETLNRMMRGSTWKIFAASNWHDALAHLNRNQISVIFCESELQDGTWKDVLEYIKKGTDPVVLVVTSPHATEDLWAEVLNLGGFDVLAKPFDQTEVCYVLATASLSRVEHKPKPKYATA